MPAAINRPQKITFERGADVRPDSNWNAKPVGGRG